MINTFTPTFLKNKTQVELRLKKRAEPEKQSSSARLYYLDWLRVLAFSFLILMHTGEIFTEKSFWIKNRETFQLFDHILFFFKQWRMPLLFIISGAAVSIMFRKTTVADFIKNRIMQVLVPLIGAMLFVIPPQIYFIEKARGNQESFSHFYLRILEFNWFPKGNLHWLHLWYLAFVFVFTLCSIPIMKYALTVRGEKIIKSLSNKISQPTPLFVYPIAASIPYYLVYSIREGNAAELLYYLPYFFFGILFITNQAISNTIRSNIRTTFFLACSTALLMYFFEWLKYSKNRDFLAFNPLTVKVSLALVKTSNQWLWLQVVLGISMRYLYYPSNLLKYLNKMVYPVYILHQTVIIIWGYYVIQIPGSITFKFTTILFGSIFIMLVLHETLLKRTAFTRLLFGIK